MNVQLNTTVVVAVLGKEHTHYGEALPWFQRIIRRVIAGVASEYSLADNIRLQRWPLLRPLRHTTGYAVFAKYSGSARFDVAIDPARSYQQEAHRRVESPGKSC